MKQRFTLKTRIKKPKNLIKKTVIGISVFTLLSIGAVSTHASFNDTGSSTITATSGKVILELNNNPDTYMMVPLEYGNKMRPGMAAVSNQVTLTNTGTVPLKYHIFASDTTALDAKINLLMKAGTTTLYNGSLNTAYATTTPTLAVGASQVVTMTLTWPATSTDREFSGQKGGTLLFITSSSL